MHTSSIIAFDFGTKSIGMAATHGVDTGSGVSCTELGTVKAREGIPNWEEIGAILEEWSPARVIVGLPVDANGDDMEITRRARKFGNRIHGRFGIDVAFIDETLSTKAAKGEALERGHRSSFAKKPVDAIAARLILESWLYEQQNKDSNT